MTHRLVSQEVSMTNRIVKQEVSVTYVIDRK